MFILHINQSRGAVQPRKGGPCVRSAENMSTKGWGSGLSAAVGRGGGGDALQSWRQRQRQRQERQWDRGVAGNH